MATLFENCNAVAAAAAEIDEAISAKGGTTTGGLGAAASAIYALPSGGAHDISLDIVACGRFDVELDKSAHLLVKTSLERASVNTSLISLGCIGDDLQKWEADNDLGKPDAKIHCYLDRDSSNMIVQTSYIDSSMSSHNWSSAQIYLFPYAWFQNEITRTTPLEIVEGIIYSFGKPISEASHQDRQGSGVFAKVLATIAADIAATGKIHVASKQSSTRSVLELYKYA